MSLSSSLVSWGPVEFHLLNVTVYDINDQALDEAKQKFLACQE